MAYCAVHSKTFSDVGECPFCAQDYYDVVAYEDDEDCYECGGEGFVLRDCFEDTCCCADPESSHGYKLCPVCRGR